MNKAKPTIMLIAIRQGHFSRELLRGVLDAQLSGQDYNVWVVPPMSDRQHLDAGLQGIEAQHDLEVERKDEEDAERHDQIGREVE